MMLRVPFRSDAVRIRHRTALRIASSALALSLAASIGGPALAQESPATDQEVASIDKDSGAKDSGVDAEPARTDIVVNGQRASSKQSALDEQRDSNAVTSVMSADEIAERPGGTIVDVISHLPGLSSFSDMGLGQAATGEQEYVTIRGIDSSYNAYTMNGVRVPQADPNSRALSLKLLPPYGLQAVKVTKTPTVDMDGDAIGGSIDIRTPTAFDYAGSMARITANGNFSQLASDLGAASGGGGGQIELARRFGQNWGVYVTGYYDRRNTAGEGVESLGYTPTLASQAQLTDLTKADGLSATGVRYDYYRNQISRYGGNFSLDYHGDNQTLYLQGSYARYGTVGEDTQHSIIGGIAGLYGNGTSYSPVGVLPGSYFQERDQTEQLLTVKLGGSTTTGRLTADYSLAYGFSKIARPNYVQGSLYGAPNLAGSATSVNLSDPAHVQVTYDSPATQAYALSQNTDRLWKFQGSDGGSSAKTYSGRADFTYDVKGGLLDTLQFGANLNVTDRSQFEHQFFGSNGDNFVILGPNGEVRPLTDPAGPTVAQLPGRNLSSFLDGSYAGVFRIYDRALFENSVLPFKYTSQFGIDPVTGAVVGNPGAYTQNDFNRNTVTGTERIAAGYLAANLQVDDLRATLGLRYENTDFSSAQYVVDGATGSFQSTSRNYGEWLPSLIVNYRPDDQIVIRGAIRRSFARPAFGLIASPLIISRNDLTGEIAGISEGNPDLKPTDAMNYDASVEYYGPAASAISINVYYKQIDNFIYAATSSGAPPSANTATVSNGGVIVSRPENGNSAELYGMELSARRSLKELPGPLDGLGLQGSLTLQHSSADSGRADHFGRRTWLPRAPRIIYNLDVFYEKYGVRTDLSYQYQGLQLVGLTSNNLDEYLQPMKTLDFSISYPIGGLTLAASAKNLTNNILFYKTLGKGTTYLGTQDGGGNGSYVATGRFFSVSASYRF